MKKFNFAKALLGFILGMAMASCEPFCEVAYVKGVPELPRDSILVFVPDTNATDTVVLVDTVYLDGEPTIKRDTIWYNRYLRFECFTLKRGYIEALSDEDSVYRTSFNSSIRTSGDVYFSKVSNSQFTLKNTTSKFAGDKARFSVQKGDEVIVLEPEVLGANMLLINNQDVTPCEPPYMDASLGNMKDTLIGDKTYQSVEVFYVLYNGYGEEIAEGSQLLFAPKEFKHEEAENDRKITFDYKIRLNDSTAYLLIFGRIDNTMGADTVTEMQIPLKLDLLVGEKQRHSVSEFKFEAGPALNVSSQKSLVKDLSESKEFMTVLYKEYENTYNHTSTASRNKTVTTMQKIRYYDEFVVSFADSTITIMFNPEVNYVRDVMQQPVVDEDRVYVDVDITYEASMAGMTATKVQEVELFIDNVISFPGEKVLYANRTISFPKRESPQAYDCVLTQVDNGGYKYRYREVYMNKSHGTWKPKDLSDAEYKFIITDGLEGKTYVTSALAVYYRENVNGAQIGYLEDFYKTNKTVTYQSYGLSHFTADNVFFALFDKGSFNGPILGTATKSLDLDGLMIMNCQGSLFNGEGISPEEIVAFF